MPNIKDAISIIQSGILTLALIDYANLKPSNILGISPGKYPRIFFDKEGFNKISQLELTITSVVSNDNQSILFPIPECQLQEFTSLTFFKKFPFFFDIIHHDNYKNLNENISNLVLYNRCRDMQVRWEELSDTVLPHFTSSLQALQRHLATKMRKPLLIDSADNFKNGLSIEYQPEIYANQLYGAKLLDAWHAFLLETKGQDPKKFLSWLKCLSPKKLNQFNLTNIDDIPTVKYITESKERSKWQLEISSKKIVSNPLLRPPKTEDEKIEIIYDLGLTETSEKAFFGGEKKRGFINHSTFFAGEKVNGAGRMQLKAQKSSTNSLNWVIYQMDDNSGHIKPDDSMNIQVLETLKKLGCDLTSIVWKSKWGSPGVRVETADLALKRLTQDFENITMPIFSDKLITTPFLVQLNETASKGLLGSVNDLLNTHMITAIEVIPAALLIKKALKSHLLIHKHDSATPETAAALAARAKQFIRMIGKKSVEFEKDLEFLVKKYKNLHQSSSGILSPYFFNNKLLVYKTFNSLTTSSKNNFIDFSYECSKILE